MPDIGKRSGILGEGEESYGMRVYSLPRRR
jgi:hypothetical protein